MRHLLALACILIATLPSSAANFPYIRLNGKTNVVSDNGTNLTYNGSALAGGAPTYSGITNAMSWSGDTNNVIGGDGRERTVGEAWTATTNQTPPVWPDDFSQSVNALKYWVSPLPTNSAVIAKNNIAFYGDSGHGHTNANTNPLFDMFNYAGFQSLINMTGGPEDDQAGGGLVVYGYVTDTNNFSNTFEVGAITFSAATFDTNTMPLGGAYFSFNAARFINGENWTRTNEMILTVNSDGGNPGFFNIVSDGYDATDSPNPDFFFGGVGRIGINTSTPRATLETVSRYSDKPQQIWSHLNGTIMGQITYDGSLQVTNTVSAGSTNAWKLGAVKTCSGLTMIVTNYIEVVINGVTNAIPLGTITP